MTRWTLPQDGTAPVPGRKEDAMTDIDLTPEAVERLASDLDLARKVMFDMGTFETGQAICADAAATLRALSAKLAEVEAERDRLRKSVEFWTSEHEKRWVTEKARAEAAEAALASANMDLNAFREMAAQLAADPLAENPLRSALRLRNAVQKARADALREVLALPYREERLGGQRHNYVRVEEVRALIPQEKPHE